jgi:3-methylfumaryl-CoA hydratase
MSGDPQRWIGRSETVEDIASPVPLAGLAALLDHTVPPWSEGELPPLAHWLYFLERTPQSELGPDGHPKRGEFLPPIALPRRMWAGSRIVFHAPIPVGAAMTRRSTIANVAQKTGASGTMVFVTVQHEISTGDVLAVTDEHDVVYREASKPGDMPPPPKSDGRVSSSTRTVVPDSVMLFRYSALTFNGHRIHYDRNYARDVEGYPGLVVHGPLIATLLMDHFLHTHSRSSVSHFEFRAHSPLFDTAPFELCADGRELWARGPRGETAMRAKIQTR